MLPAVFSTEASAEARTALWDRLDTRRGEIEQAVLTRVFAIDLGNASDPEYVEGIRTAASAAIEYGLAAIRHGEVHSPSPPPALLAQARLAARNCVNLDTVLRRYFAGYALVADFLVEEAERNDALGGLELQRLLRSQAALLERVIAAVSEEHGRESAGRLGSRHARRAERVERLLAGELVDVAEIPYDFEGHHLGAIVSGAGAAEMLRQIAGELDRRLLAIPRGGETVWAWFGGRRRVGSADLQRCALAIHSEASMAIGEPAHGLAGWRLTHQQARAALPIAVRGPDPLVRYVDVALLAAILQDHLLATSLHDLYLEPLKAERNGGEVLRDTVRAYLATSGNITSAATMLGVRRQTVTNRIRAVEERLGRDLNTCTAEMEAALRLEELTSDQPALSHRTQAAISNGQVSTPVGEVMQ